MTRRAPTIGLCMIVRDEARVVERCLASVRRLVDVWTVVDTGSRDDTPARVRDALAGLPGRLHHRPWRDFGHNRSELLALARGTADYLLLLDADMTLRREGPLPPLEADAYLLRTAGALDYAVPRLVRGDRRWWFEGVTHEHLATEGPFRQDLLDALVVEHHADGGARAGKLERDRALLEARLQEEPGDLRALFYLAQTRRDAGDDREAEALYLRRAAAGGWEEERFYAAWQAGVLRARRDPVGSARLLGEAAALRPSRAAEPLCDLARLCREQGWHAAAYAAARRAAAVPYPADVLFVHRDVYRWAATLELAVAAHWTGHPREALRLADRLLVSTDLPDHLEPLVRDNRRHAEQALAAAGRDPTLPRLGSPPLLAELTTGLTVGEVLLDVEPDWPHANPTIARDGAGWRMVVRTVNHRLEDHGYESLDGTATVRTVNHLVRLDDALRVTRVDALEDRSGRPGRPDALVQGLEDLRLVRVGDRWHGVTTVYDRSPDGLPQVALVRLDEHRVTDVHVLPSEPGTAEKNWVPFAGDGDERRVRLLYTAAPTTVLDVDVLSGAVLAREQAGAPAWALGLRGGSQAVPAGEHAHLAVVHEIVPGPVLGRRYLHRLVLLERAEGAGPVRLAAASLAFSFTGDPVEFCAGLAHDGERLVLAFGVHDRLAALGVLPLAEALATLAPVGAARSSW
jgi:hypothetical protein